MRTHYGMAGVECMTCEKPHQFLLLPRHGAEGVRHHQCGGVAATAVTAKRLIADVEERERAAGGGPWSGEDGETRDSGDGIRVTGGHGMPCPYEEQGGTNVGE